MIRHRRRHPAPHDFSVHNSFPCMSTSSRKTRRRAEHTGHPVLRADAGPDRHGLSDWQARGRAVGAAELGSCSSPQGSSNRSPAARSARVPAGGRPVRARRSWSRSRRCRRGGSWSRRGPGAGPQGSRPRSALGRGGSGPRSPRTGCSSRARSACPLRWAPVATTSLRRGPSPRKGSAFAVVLGPHPSAIVLPASNERQRGRWVCLAARPLTPRGSGLR
jgi:hypothetical protein